MMCWDYTGLLVCVVSHIGSSLFTSDHPLPTASRHCESPINDNIAECICAHEWVFASIKSATKDYVKFTRALYKSKGSQSYHLYPGQGTKELYLCMGAYFWLYFFMIKLAGDVLPSSTQSWLTAVWVV